MVLFNRGTSLARLYSLARDPRDRGASVGAALLAAAEQVARERDAAYMRLEVRADALATQAFYRAQDYRKFHLQPHYYEDDVAAVRMEKSLASRPDPAIVRVPYYAQSLDFTCGPAALLMAMRAHDPSVHVDPRAEVRLWREFDDGVHDVPALAVAVRRGWPSPRIDAASPSRSSSATAG